jgi:hypothetical protein
MHLLGCVSPFIGASTRQNGAMPSRHYGSGRDEGFNGNRGVLALQTMKIGPVGALLLFCAYAHAQPRPVTSAQLQYQVRQCTLSGSSVTCAFRITNLGPPRLVMHRCGPGTGVGAGGQTRAYDNLGNEYSGEACTLATVGPVYGDVAERIGASPVEATAVFRHVQQSATTLPLIIVVGSSENVRIKVSFKNVPIIR